MAAAGVDVLLVSHPVHVHYLTGVDASAGMLLVGPDRLSIVADARYLDRFAEAAANRADVDVVPVPVGESYEGTVAAAVRRGGIATLGIEADHLTVGRLGAIERALGGTACTVHASSGILEQIRAVKDAWELSRLLEAGRRLAGVAACILPDVTAGQTERDVAWRVEVALRGAGFARPAFETIVASGPNAARPHHRAGAREIAQGDVVIVDFGGVLDGYSVDMSRTVPVGDISAEQHAWLAAVADAQAAAVRAAGPGVLPSAVDGAARAALASHGLAEAFVHSTGHGLGLEVHERPTIGPRGDDHGPLVPGMVLTIEPGVYLAGRGGVRIEDDFVVTSTGVECLTGSTTGP